MPTRTFHGRRSKYDLHLHLDSHVGASYAPQDYVIPLLECGFDAAGFLMHDAVAPVLPPLPFETFRGAELTIPFCGRRPRGHDYLVAHLAGGVDVAEAVPDLAAIGVDILAHPFAPEYRCSSLRGLYAALACEGIALEYNGARGGPAEEYVEAVRRGVEVTFGSDAHGPGGVMCDVPGFVTPLEELSFMRNLR
jgi:hypothetical protein